MKFFAIVLLISFHSWQCQGIQSSCRSNCSMNDTICWREALIYRSSELVERLFSFSSLSVYVDAYRRHHSNEFNNTIEFIDRSLENNLINESNNVQLNQTVFTEATDLLLHLCRNLTSTPLDNVKQFPPLACSTTTCLSDIYNYLVLFIISALVSSLILIICIVQFFQTRRQAKLFQSVPQTNPLPNSFSTANTSVNSPYLLIMFYSFGSGCYLFTSLFVIVYGERDLFQKKCRRDCNTEHATLRCWQQTTDGFAYGLSTAMVDYCQVMIELRRMNNPSWYNISREILSEQIKKYDLDEKVRQLTKEDIEQVSFLILNKCFETSSSSSIQPPCPSCSIRQVQLTRQWRITTLILTSIGVFFVFLTLLFYLFHIRHTRRSYQTIT